MVTGDEGASEVDIIIESAAWVWFVEAKYRSDISAGTKTRPARDQVLRNIDVGSHYAGVRQFYLSLLIASAETSPLGVARAREYEGLDIPRERLRAHRPDGLTNLTAVGLLDWAELAAVLSEAAAEATEKTSVPTRSGRSSGSGAAASESGNSDLLSQARRFSSRLESECQREQT